MDLKKLYTLVLEPTDACDFKDHPPIIAETDISLATLKNMRGIKKRIESAGQFTAKVARVIVSDLDNATPVKSSSALLLPDDNRVDELLLNLSAITDPHVIHSDHYGDESMRAHLRLKVLEWVRTL